MPKINLIPEALDALSKNDEERIAFISMDRWIDYPAAQNILKMLESIKTHEKGKTRIASRLLVGSSNNGKTYLLQKFITDNPPYDYYRSNPDILTEEFFDKYTATGIPALYVLAPSEPNEARLYSNILNSINAPFKERDTNARKQYLVEYYLELLNVDMLIIDEIHNILSGSIAKQKQVMNAIKNLSNTIKIPIVLSGTKDALRAISTDTQIDSRFRPMYLKKWKMDKDFVSMLATILTTLPLRKESDILTPQVAQKILNLTDGCIGDIINLFKQSAIYAIETKSERITIKELQECGYISMKHVFKDINLQEI